jgi:diguanylate cyclase (GGDEF)-like protein
VTSRELAALERERLVALREQATDPRGALAGVRDASAARRDQEADDRDDARAASELLAASLEARNTRDFSPRAMESLAIARRVAGLDRGRAGNDRRLAASDRAHAEADRSAASRDREISVLELELANTDVLTGTLQRGAGFFELEQEIARAQQLSHGFVLGFADVVGLKTINDLYGHAKGDEVLRKVAETLRMHLRRQDKIVRYGGDEFVYTGSGLSIKEGKARATDICTFLDRSDASVTIGLAEWQAEDSLETLLSRADNDLYEQRGRARSTPITRR